MVWFLSAVALYFMMCSSAVIYLIVTAKPGPPYMSECSYLDRLDHGLCEDDQLR